MKFLSGILVVALTGVAALFPAYAADMYRVPSIDYKDGPAYTGEIWGGFYVGVNGGYGWADSDSGIDGGIGGGQIGYNFQRGNIVAGLETDFDGADISKGSESGTLDYFGTVRGRVGYAFERALVYGTGGFGYAGCSGCSGDSNYTGWVAGGGIEYKFTPSWSLKAEYQYLGTSSGGNFGIDSIRAGVNYFVGGAYEPLK